MKKLILTLALGFILISLNAQIRVHIGTKHRGIINQTYHSNYSTNRHNIIPCCQNLDYCLHKNKRRNNRYNNRNNNSIWVEGHWKWSRRYNDYIWVGGHWLKRRQGRTYITGSYTLRNGINIWVRGFWR